ncbi:Acetylornithine/succinyldiaminopimelate aminotransferase [Paraburkholderia kirstenboschensis]|nr:Acetylornithine/succinyldiaminopimelate aminotransferase [Paraburkholderia kirstenboschensis]
MHEKKAPWYFAAGIAVLNTGHRHPGVIAAVREQLDRFTHTCYQIVPYASYVELAETLNARVPGAFDKKTALFSTGAEAVENAIKIARVATGRPAVIAFGGSVHGRTMMGMALTGKVAPKHLRINRCNSSYRRREKGRSPLLSGYAVARLVIHAVLLCASFV